MNQQQEQQLTHYVLELEAKIGELVVTIVKHDLLHLFEDMFKQWEKDKHKVN